jgi:hypothetical protein
MEWVTGCAFAISFTADGQCLSGTIEAGYFARYLKGMYLSSLPEGVAGAEIGDGTGLLNGGPNPGDEALLEIGFQQDVVNPTTAAFAGILSSSEPVMRIIGAVMSRLRNRFARSILYEICLFMRACLLEME